MAQQLQPVEGAARRAYPCASGIAGVEQVEVDRWARRHIVPQLGLDGRWDHLNLSVVEDAGADIVVRDADGDGGFGEVPLGIRKDQRPDAGGLPVLPIPHLRHIRQQGARVGGVFPLQVGVGAAHERQVDGILDPDQPQVVVAFHLLGELLPPERLLYGKPIHEMLEYPYLHGLGWRVVRWRPSLPSIAFPMRSGSASMALRVLLRSSLMPLSWNIEGITDT